MKNTFAAQTFRAHTFVPDTLAGIAVAVGGGGGDGRYVPAWWIGRPRRQREEWPADPAEAERLATRVRLIQEEDELLVLGVL